MGRLGLPGAALLAVAALCFGAPLVAAALGTHPHHIDPDALYAGPSLTHPLGTDELGRDLLLRLLYGGRVSLLVALLAAPATVALGAGIGLLSGFMGGRVDAVLMRFTEAMMALPKLPLMMLASAVSLPELGGGLTLPILRLAGIIVLFGWMRAARVTRASVRAVGREGFVEAARAAGARPLAIARDHHLPHVAGPLAILLALEVGSVVIYESVLSFLGLGIPPPWPSWGAMLAEGFTQLARAPRLVLLPGLLTVVVVMAANALGDAFDARARPV